MGRLVLLNGRRSPFGFRAKPKPVSRNDRILELRASGQTFQSIAEHFGISNARVQQICKRGHAKQHGERLSEQEDVQGQEAGEDGSEA
jgi:hypothetical protein